MSSAANGASGSNIRLPDGKHDAIHTHSDAMRHGEHGEHDNTTTRREQRVQLGCREHTSMFINHECVCDDGFGGGFLYVQPHFVLYLFVSVAMLDGFLCVSSIAVMHSVVVTVVFPYLCASNIDASERATKKTTHPNSVGNDSNLHRSVFLWQMCGGVGVFVRMMAVSFRSGRKKE